MQEVVNLYRLYPKYNNISDDELRLYLMPSMKLRQCKTHYEDEEVIGFTNWAFLSDEAQKKFKKIGWLKEEEWL